MLSKFRIKVCCLSIIHFTVQLKLTILTMVAYFSNADFASFMDDADDMDVTLTKSWKFYFTTKSWSLADSLLHNREKCLRTRVDIKNS